MSLNKRTYTDKSTIITADNLNDIQDAIIDLEDNAALSDGVYEGMTVGNAEQLVATVGIEDRAPYNFRTAGGSADIGDRLRESIIGGTVAWNQLLKNGNFADTSQWATNTEAFGTYTVDDNVATFTCGSSVDNSSAYFRNNSLVSIADHVQFAIIDVNPSRSTTFRFSYSAAASNTKEVIEPANEWSTYFSVVKTKIASNGALFYFNVSRQMQENDTILFRNAMVIDLTLMFGSTIADYVYTLEQSTAGSGIAWLKSYGFFTEDYYATQSGKLESVNAAAHVTTGFNLWDPETDSEGKSIANDGTLSDNSSWAVSDYIRVFPGTSYYFRNVAPSANANTIAWYDSAKTFIKVNAISGTAGTSTSGSKTSPDNAAFMRVQRLKAETQFCVSLRWDGERDGEYEPYTEHTYPLDSSLTLLGLPKLDANNKLYYDGDTYDADGTVTRRYGIVDLGTLEWTHHSPSGSVLYDYFSAVTTGAGIKPAESSNVAANVICGRYVTVNAGQVAKSGYDKTIALSAADAMFIADSSYTDAATFTTAMSGVYLVYELATPTTESADPFTEVQIVDDFGTEEYVDAAAAAGTRDVAIPVGHTSFYAANLRAKLEMAPDSPGGDGDYVVRQSGGENSYVRLDGTALAGRVPACSTSEDGTFTLKATVAEGAVTYAWVADEA